MNLEIYTVIHHGQPINCILADSPRLAQEIGNTITTNPETEVLPGTPDHHGYPYTPIPGQGTNGEILQLQQLEHYWN